MSVPVDTDMVKLTAYEGEQVWQIAAWKSEPPNPLGELFKMATLPGTRVVENMIPDKFVRALIEKGYDLSERLAGQHDPKRMAGFTEPGAMRGRSLEACDRLASQIGTRSQTISAIEGAITGAGGPLTTLIDIPLLFVLSLQTIPRKSAHLCFRKSLLSND